MPRNFRSPMPSDSTTTPVLDAFDRAILAILQRDNTVAQREIARAVHLSAPAVQRRIRRLRDSGVIRAEVAVLDASRLGRPLTLMVEGQRPRAVVRALRAESDPRHR